ncbi:MAG: hypothetical protein ACNA7U_07480, partial [Candidatus Izemoplasmataceae bacterium]
MDFEIELIYEDILFSHQEYSNIIFDSMYEFLQKFQRFTFKSESVGITQNYLNQLKDYAKNARHQMRVEDYIKAHNLVIEPFNNFIETYFKLKPIPIYEFAQFEGKIKELVIHKVINELGILKLSEQYAVMKYYKHQRKDLRLQMFFENVIRYFTNANATLTFYEILNDFKLMHAFVYQMLDGIKVSDAQVKHFIIDLKQLNIKRNKIKHNSIYDTIINYDRIEWYILLITNKLVEKVEAFNKKVFINKQSLLEYHLAFRELSFNYKYATLNRIGNAILFDDELFQLLKDDRAYQAYYVKKIMESDMMQLIQDYEKIQSTIKEFHHLVNELERINEAFSDAKDQIDKV